MKPRKNTSLKWTKFPKEYESDIVEIFTKEFSEHLQDSEIIAEGRIYPEEICLLLGIQKKGRLHQDNFETSIDYDFDKDNAAEKIGCCIDALASLIEESLKQDEPVDYPRDWQSFEFEGEEIFLRYSTRNTNLESQADALLGISNDALVHEDNIGEDALDRSDIL